MVRRGVARAHARRTPPATPEPRAYAASPSNAMSSLQRRATANRLLAALPPAEFERLTSGSERVRLTKGRILIEAGETVRHALGLLTQITQSAACHRFHTVEQRLAHWLLITRDRAGSDTFQLTQEFLSNMLGVPRKSVTALAVGMRKAGLISYERGRITLLDARRLEASSCECYRIVAREIAAA